VVEPKVLFLDEPFSALDYEMTLLMRDQLQRVLGESNTTTLVFGALHEAQTPSLEGIMPEHRNRAHLLLEERPLRPVRVPECGHQKSPIAISHNLATRSQRVPEPSK
jgi:ABC-type nitrate/sulfonate/bicarbonate transport system ATPase subunit